MAGGWTIQEWDTDDFVVTYWIVSPRGTNVCSFASKERARVYWRKHQRGFLTMRNADSGRKLAEECGLVWDSLDDFEKNSWTDMANKHGDRREDDVDPGDPFGKKEGDDG